MPWQPGQSGNPKGRPAKGRTLTVILERAGEKKVLTANGDKIGGKRLIAQYVWQLATEGECVLPNGRILRVERAAELFELIRWLYAHIDGLPKLQAEIDQMSTGQITVRFIANGNSDQLVSAAETSGITEGDWSPQLTDGSGTTD